MSLLTICQDVADEVGLDQPTSIIGNTDITAVRMRRQASKTGKMLAKKKWHQLIKSASLSTSSGEPQYALPSDYGSLVPNTIWNQTTDQPVFKISPQVWAYEKSVTTAPFHDRFRLMGDDAAPSIGAKITIHPTPTATETIAYEYYSENWLTDSTGSTERADWAADGDVPIFDEELFTMGVVWRMLSVLGQPYLEEKTEFDRLVEIGLAQSGGTEKLHADGNTTPISNIPETGFG